MKKSLSLLIGTLSVRLLNPYTVKYHYHTHKICLVPLNIMIFGVHVRITV